MKLYTIGCPLCDILEEIIRERKIPVEIVTDKEIIEQKGYELFPVLVTDNDEEFVGGEALRYINEEDNKWD